MTVIAKYGRDNRWPPILAAEDESESWHVTHTGHILELGMGQAPRENARPLTPLVTMAAGRRFHIPGIGHTSLETKFDQ